MDEHADKSTLGDHSPEDRQYFGLDAEQWTAFLEALDQPAREIPEVARLFREPSIFESPE